MEHVFAPTFLDRKYVGKTWALQYMGYNIDITASFWSVNNDAIMEL